VKRDRSSVGVLGIGRVGLPLALLFAEAGYRVVACDTNGKRVADLRRGRSPLREIDSKRIRAAVRGGLLAPTTDFSELSAVHAAILCVPTPLTAHREPDLTHVVCAAKEVARYARRGVLVVLESTTYPGTTRDVVRPILEARGWRVGKDFFLAFSPEREDPSNPTYSTKNIPKLVGGVDTPSLERARRLYSDVIDLVVPVESCEIAEAAKLLENVFRAVNVALVNELKVVFHHMGIDVWDVIAAASTKPFGFMPFFPGPGLGGHCTPIDPFYLTWKAREFDVPTKFIELAGEVNRLMPSFVLDRVRSALNERRQSVRGARILVLGVAYKRNVDDVRESPAIKLIELLEHEGALVEYHDPLVPRLPRARRGFRGSVPLSRQRLAAANLVLVATDHEAVDYDRVLRDARLIVDTRRVFRPDGKKVLGA
jgi:UDP-N-acetyl-D-glucosamine dehydrogenase